ncbi:MAG: hypothetical protein O3A13_14265 [Proteobacteria bacterium]|nr:hypothetical protein [Pseudomonadota bacterium]
MTFRPLTHRAFEWFASTLSVPPVIAGIVCSLGFGGIALWITVVIGTVANVTAGIVPSIAVRAPVTLYMMVGYLPMAAYYLFVWTRNHQATIVRCFALQSSPIAFPRLTANWIGALGIVVMYFSFLHESEDPFLLLAPWRWPVGFAFPLVGLVIMGWFNFRFTYLLIWTSLAISRTAQQIDYFNLLDTSLVKPYAQQGVRASLLAVVSLSISANLWLDPGSPAAGTATSVVMLSVAAAIALFLPTWGIHQRLRTLKRDELKQVRVAIESRRNPASRSIDDAQHLRADLALERRLDEVSEWPFDAGSYGRVALYIMLGLGSWVGAALVERLLESLSP